MTKLSEAEVEVQENRASFGTTLREELVTHRLQSVSNEAEETSETSSRTGNNLVSSSGELRASRCGGSGGNSSWGSGGRDGTVRVDDWDNCGSGGSGGSGCSTSDGDLLGDSAWAWDGDDTGGGNDNGGTSEAQGGGRWAVGGGLVDNISGPDNGTVGGGNDGGQSGGDGDHGELHLD